MRKTLLFTCLLFLKVLYVNAQPSHTRISEHLARHFENYFSENWVDYISQIYMEQEMKDSILRELSTLAAIEKEDTVEEEMTLFAYDSLIYVSPIMELDSRQYACLKYTIKATLDFSDSKGEGGLELALAYAMESLKSNYGEENVTFDPQTTSLTYRQYQEVYYVKDPAFDDWQFYYLGIPNLHNKSFPQEVLDKL